MIDEPADDQFPEVAMTVNYAPMNAAPLWKRLLALASYRCRWTPEEADTLQKAIALLKAWEDD